MAGKKNMRQIRETANYLRVENGLNKQLAPSIERAPRVKPKPSRVVGFSDL